MFNSCCTDLDVDDHFRLFLQCLSQLTDGQCLQIQNQNKEEKKEIFGIQNYMEWCGIVVTHPFPIIFIAIEFAVLCSLGC